MQHPQQHRVSCSLFPCRVGEASRPCMPCPGWWVGGGAAPPPPCGCSCKPSCKPSCESSCEPSCTACSSWLPWVERHTWSCRPRLARGSRTQPPDTAWQQCGLAPASSRSPNDLHPCLNPPPPRLAGGASRPLPPTADPCLPAPTCSFWGEALVWGNAHKTVTAAACCQACKTYQPVPEKDDLDCNGGGP